MGTGAMKSLPTSMHLSLMVLLLFLFQHIDKIYSSQHSTFAYQGGGVILGRGSGVWHGHGHAILYFEFAYE